MSDIVSFHLAFKFTLNQLALLKQKIVRNNNQAFILNSFLKAVMERSKFKNKFNKERKVKNWSEEKHQHNSDFLKQFEKLYFNSLNVKVVTVNKIFWKTIKSFCTDKTETNNNIIITENNHTGRKDNQICQNSLKNMLKVSQST